MEYNPAHKTSSITSITSTSTASTWDHPITPSISNNYSSLVKAEEEYAEFDASLVSERIAIPPFEYFEDTISNLFEIASTDELPELLLSSSTIKKDAFSASHNSTYITNENHNHQSDNMTHLEPIYLRQANQMTLNNSVTMTPTTHIEKQKAKELSTNDTIKNTLPSHTTTTTTTSLTEDEKRTNHIISEQKRRNTIRIGFKELTEIIPTLKNINNSKSTILFKAVEFIKHLEKRNRVLKDKVNSLQIKLQVQGRIQKRPEKRYHQELSSLPSDTLSALIAHKNQQKQLELLQNQLRIQNQLLQQHNITPPFPTINTLQQQQNTYHSISIPSSRSSENDEHPPSSFWPSSN